MVPLQTKGTSYKIGECNEIDYGRQRQLKLNQQNEIRRQHLHKLLINTEHF